MLGSVCTVFYLGSSPDGVAGKSFLSIFFFFFVVVVLSNIFISVPSNFRCLFNSSSTFKYIVGLSLQSEIPLCILCTVLGKLNGEYLWWGIKTLPFNGVSWVPKGGRMI